MNILGNILWLVFGGLLTALWYFIYGVRACITIVGIPFGIALWRMAVLSLAPFGKKVEISPDRGGCFMILFDVLWILFGWWEIAIAHAILGLLFCITIVGIPFGIQLLKIAGFALWPFGRQIVAGETDGGCLSLIMNVIWIILGGVEIALAHIGLGIGFCITIIGIPFGLQHFKMALLALTPFGKQIS